MKLISENGYILVSILATGLLLKKTKQLTFDK